MAQISFTVPDDCTALDGCAFEEAGEILGLVRLALSSDAKVVAAITDPRVGTPTSEVKDASELRLLTARLGGLAEVYARYAQLEVELDALRRRA